MRFASPRLAGPARRWFGLALPVLALVAGPVLPASAQTNVLSPAAQKQVAEVYAFKKTFTEAEKKMSFNLVLLSRQAHNQPLGSLARFVNKGAIDSTGKVLLNLQGDLSPSLLGSPALSSSRKIDGEVPGSAVASHTLRAHVSASDLATLAASSDVRSLHEASRATTNVGSVTSQGYITHTANKAVALGVTGAGVNVGVLSDSASPAEVAALIASGDLPANVTVLPGQAGTGEDEGTAMMEIIHDLAPSSNLFFATAFNGEQSMADNIRALRFTYHCDIIVDDVTYFDEGAFQDGLIAQAVNDVVADGGLYFSAAANSGNLTSGTSGTWEGDFKSGGSAGGPVATLEGGPVPINSFGPTNYDQLTAAGSLISLKWSDPLGAASDDYDLFILDSTGTTLKAFSAMTQNGSQDPYEEIDIDPNCDPGYYCAAYGDRIIVAKFAGAARALHIDTERGALSIGTAGATFGHNAGKSTFTLAATYWNSARTGAKPFTGAANPIETFSSDGPRRIFFNPDGTPITPGKFLFANGGVTLQKPDATAADGIYTKTPGFLPFFGTSAAAPHAAAIAALVKSANPKLTNAQITKILHSSVVDNMEPGPDRDGGYGVMLALPAVQAASPSTK